MIIDFEQKTAVLHAITACRCLAPDCSGLVQKDSIYCASCNAENRGLGSYSWHPTKENYIYFIEAVGSDCIKIGRAADVEKRLYDLQTANHCELKLLYSFSAAVKVEGLMHDMLKELNIRGEWFKKSKELLDYIEELRIA